jgi:hypothetical protein
VTFLSPTASRTGYGTDALTVRCDTCGVELRQRPAFDGDIALGTFLQCHPAAEGAIHRPDDLPAGWSLDEPRTG